MVVGFCVVVGGVLCGEGVMVVGGVVWGGKGVGG